MASLDFGVASVVQWRPMSANGLRSQAEALVGAARILAANSYTQVAERHDALCEVDQDYWDLTMTVGGVFVALNRLTHIGASEDRVALLTDVVSRNLTDWDERAVTSFENCSDFFVRTVQDLEALPEYTDNPEFLLTDAIGAWITWNLFGHAPASEEERLLVRALGGIVFNAFFSWWDPESLSGEQIDGYTSKQRWKEAKRSDLDWRPE